MHAHRKDTVIHWKWIPLFSRERVVTEESAARFFGDAREVPASDHFSICKPKDKTDAVHQYLYEFMSRENLLPTPDMGLAEQCPDIDGNSRVSSAVYGGGIHFNLSGPVGIHEEKNEPNGRFWAEINFRLSNPQQGARLRTFRLDCYNRRGIIAYKQDQKLYLTGQEGTYTELGLIEGDVLSEPVRLESGETPMLRAVAWFRPYLQRQYAYEWDYGCLALSGTISGPGDMIGIAFSIFYKYTGARSLELVPPPEVPCLSDAELSRRRDQGLLSEDEERTLCTVSAMRRYLLYCGELPDDGEDPTVVRLIRALEQRLKEDYVPVGANGEIPRIWRQVLPAGTRSVTLPSAPRNPRSVCLTEDGREIAPISVHNREVSWDFDLPRQLRVLFRYLE
jgi:hypothetical protein